jgi:hypothetical protein
MGDLDVEKNELVGAVDIVPVEVFFTYKDRNRNKGMKIACNFCVTENE